MSQEALAPGRPRLVPLLALAVGLLTVVLGLGLALIGLGFASASDSGTGLAAAVTGLVTLPAIRGLRRRRTSTLVLLAVAWAWLITRVVLDWEATAASGAIVLFLLPSVSVPLDLAWALLTPLLLAALAFRGVRSLRGRAAADPTDRSPPLSACDGRPGRGRGRAGGHHSRDAVPGVARPRQEHPGIGRRLRQRARLPRVPWAPTPWFSWATS